jgi:DNA-binding Lrp family transcriptional regulator
MAVASVQRTGQLTERDLEIAGWLDRLGAASIEQIAARFGLGRTQVYRRAQVLVSFGLIRRRKLLAARPALYTPTGRSLRPASYEHSLTLAALVLARERAGALIFSEAELRRERANQRALPSRRGEAELATVISCRRVPDAVEVLPTGGLLAYEVELSSKGRRRREAAIAAYAASDYRGVRWIVPDRQLAALLRAELHALGVEGFMEVWDGLQGE